MKERGSGGVAEEASKSLRRNGWITKVTRDAVICPRCKCLIYPDAKSGCFDIRVAVPIWERKDFEWFAIEVKYAKTALPFNEIDEAKRIWAAEGADEYNMWIWLCMGKAIYNKKYPRTTYLFPLELFYEIERNASRKSIKFNHPALEQYKLNWLGDHMWDVTLDNLAIGGEWK